MSKRKRNDTEEIAYLRRQIQTLLQGISDGGYVGEFQIPEPVAEQRYALSSSDGVYLIEDRFDYDETVFLNTLDPYDLLEIVGLLNKVDQPNLKKESA